MTVRAADAFASVDVVIGYKRYVELIGPFTKGKEVLSSGMGREKSRCRKAIELASSGSRVAMVSSGDAGVYGMAGLVLQLAGPDASFAIEVVPGVPAFISAAAALGAPLMHDFAVISLSDILTSWTKIETRIEMAARADFVIILYNPKSSKRTTQLPRAIEIIAGFRDASTPVGIVRNASRRGERVVVGTLGGFHKHLDLVDMTTTVVVGNSETYVSGGKMITPRGYR